MSVFSDFQRMWVQRFPQSSLSDAWENDVRASLTRHRQKITELTKELEQETLYVEYLERLLSDVEKYREAGGNPQALFEVATPPSTAAGAISNVVGTLDDDKTSIKDDNTLIKAAPSLDISNKSQQPSSEGGGDDDGVTDDKNARHKNDASGGKKNTLEDNEKQDNLIQLRRDGALNQCITELSNLRRSISTTVTPQLDHKKNDLMSISTTTITEPSGLVSPSKSRRNSQSDAISSSGTAGTGAGINLPERATSLLAQPSHFVTVIEVKESIPASSKNQSASLDRDTVKEVKERKDDEEDIDDNEIVGISKNSFGSGDRKIFKPSLPTGLSADVKKKVPPRPPPKFIRRAAPVDPPTVPVTVTTGSTSGGPVKRENESPSSSLERNIKPSEILRQKSSDSLDIKLGERKNPTTSLTKSSDLADEFNRRVKSDSLERARIPLESIKSAQSPTGSLNKTTSTTTGASPTGSLGKLTSSRSTDSPTGSLGKSSNKANDSLQSIGSKESLASQGVMLERIKSYESISSLSSDSNKGHGQNFETEPYYDTVPMDNGDGDYVYIQAGGTGSTSSRDDISTAGSTLPLPSHSRSHTISQTSVEPESPGRSSNYVNIDYFLSENHEPPSNDSDGEGEPPPALMRAISHDDPITPNVYRKLSSINNRNTTIHHIISSIITSETFYVECLNIMMQYMKAFGATLTTSQPVITAEEFQTMFFKIEDLHSVHTEFLTNLKRRTSQDGELCVGDIFKKLAGHIHLYGAFLHNYGRAIDTVKKCGQNNTQFKEIVSKIVLNSQNEQSLTLEDLLHKPVARVQKNALVLQDLLNETPQSHADYLPLKQAQKIIRNFLSEFNIIQTKSMFPSDDKALRRLVKNSFIVELADGHRKLRHLFLFNDVIACAKYKAYGRDRLDFELKWFIPLKDIVILEESIYSDLKEANPVNILQLKSQACTVRDQIMLEEKDEKKQRSNGSRAGDKHRKKLADLEGQLVLVSPNLIFRIGNKATNKTMIFFLSSDYERTQWIESIITLQQSCNLPGVTPVNIYDLQAWITACQALIKTEMGSYLMRNSRDESLLIGDLHFTIQGLTGLEQPADLYICVEIDSYGHYFRKAKTKLICRSSSPLWNETYVLELEGSQNLRILLYEDHPHRPILRAKHILRLSRAWLKEIPINNTIKLTDLITLNTTMKFVPGEVTLRRVPTSKPGALFGAKLQQVLKREKRDIPFIISACIREVERRGMGEVGIYRVSGSASDLARLKKSFETNPYEAEQLLKEVDIHSVTGILKSYLRDLPEALFTDQYYPKLFDTFNKFSNLNEADRIDALIVIFNELPSANRNTIGLILDHLIRVHHQEAENKMSLHNLAMVFGPTLLRPGPTTGKQKDGLESSTVDVMAQAGILYCFLQAKIK